jgi:hypothetical protein
MGHHVRIRQDPGWALGSLWTSAEQTALDASLIASVNGDGGGTWSPTANVVIQGKGVRLIATTHTISGSHSSVSTNGTTKRLTHGDSDYCVLGPGHAGASVSLRSPVTDARYPMGWSPLGVLTPFAIFATQLGAIARVPLRVHNGARFNAFQFSFSVSLGAVAIPAQLPRFAVFARDAFGDLITVLPYQTVATPANLTAWVAGGATQTFTTTLGAGTGPLVDTSQYSYFAEIVEVSGTGAVQSAITYFDPVMTFDSVLDIRPR